MRSPPWWAGVSVPSVGIWDLGRQDCLSRLSVLKSEKSFLRYGLPQAYLKAFKGDAS